MTQGTKVLSRLVAACVAVLLAGGMALAADPNGTWAWTFETPNGEVEIKLDLKADGEKLTGKVYRGERETEISDGTFKDDEVSFKTVRERDGNTFVMTYRGQVEGDAIKGTIGFEFGGQSQDRDWHAKRVRQ